MTKEIIRQVLQLFGSCSELILWKRVASLKRLRFNLNSLLIFSVAHILLLAITEIIRLLVN